MQQQLTDASLEQDALLVNESLFAQGNGYLGIRGNFEEGYGDGMTSIRGAYLNAFYETVTINYGEKCYGDPADQQKLPNLPDAQSITLYLGDDREPVNLFSGDVLAFSRTLDLAGGVASRMFHWRSPKGREIRVTVRRLVSFTRRELLAIDYQVDAVNFAGPITVRSTVNGDVSNFTAKDDPRLASGHAQLLDVVSVASGAQSQLVAKTRNSDLTVAVSCAHVCASDVEVEEQAGDKQIETELRFNGHGSLRFTKYAVYTDSRRHPSPAEAGCALLKACRQQSFTALVAEQKQYLDAFWESADVGIDGDPALQEGIRFNLFQLLQSTGRDAVSNIAAKGLSGEGYEGHYFWDTEIYVLPVMLLTQPELAKNLLRFRYQTLDGARARAREMGHQQGALFPWRTISGSECSAFFPAGTAQYHISADVAWAFVQYWKATGDLDFIVDCGAEVVFETARLWLDAGHFGADGKFRLDAVTGPDEYTAVVNNNYYTNVMARHNLDWAVQLYLLLQSENEPALTRLVERLALDAAEVADWQHAARQMYLPYDISRDINPQDDSFLDKKRWDVAATPDEKFPLLLNYHPLVLYRHQVCKQPDVILAHYLLDGVAEESTMACSYDYYEPLTTHDSSLSSCVFSIMAARLGRLDQAAKYFAETARLDLDNTHGNTRDGLHIANLAGTWQGIVFGFGGVRLGESRLRLAPALPASWGGYRFRVNWRGRLIEVHVCRACTRVRLVKGEPAELEIHGKIQWLEDTLEVTTRS